MPRSTFAGHPLHPMLVVAPGGLLPFALVMDLMHVATGRQAYADAARFALIGGAATGLAAGVAGAMDYMTIPPEAREKKTANVHAALNVAAMAATMLNVAMRAKGSDAREPLPLALSAMTAIGVGVSGWFGAHLVYEHGLRVQERDPLSYTPEAKLPGDDALKAGLEAIEDATPTGGPTTADADYQRPPLH
ncbi:MAG TPA: DUF2231 domain-containing protein [Burkholderiaceae bacterium]|nr:DUF2231 domain-containing protein [Burkholderiaceae bacterium]